MDVQFLASLPLFRGASQEELSALLSALRARPRPFRKGEVILRAGEPTARMGVVLSGGVNLEHVDAWGSRAILGHAGPGQVFAETYACLPRQPMMVSAVAAEDCRILFLDLGRLLEGDCPHREILLRGLLTIAAEKNLSLSRRGFHTRDRTIRGRLLAYLSDQAALRGSPTFSIPFDRQQLADYLGVDRSALSAELGKLRREGLLENRKNQFHLLTEGEDRIFHTCAAPGGRPR